MTDKLLNHLGHNMTAQKTPEGVYQVICKDDSAVLYEVQRKSAGQSAPPPPENRPRQARQPSSGAGTNKLGMVEALRAGPVFSTLTPWEQQFLNDTEPKVRASEKLSDGQFRTLMKIFRERVSNPRPAAR